MRKIFILSLICLLAFSTKSYSQSDKNEVKGNKVYELYSYSKAINYYKQADFLTVADKELAKVIEKLICFICLLILIKNL